MIVRMLQLLVAFLTGMATLSLTVKFEENLNGTPLQNEEVKVTQEFYERCFAFPQKELRE